MRILVYIGGRICHTLTRAIDNHICSHTHTHTERERERTHPYPPTFVFMPTRLACDIVYTVFTPGPPMVDAGVGLGDDAGDPDGPRRIVEGDSGGALAPALRY